MYPPSLLAKSKLEVFKKDSIKKWRRNEHGGRRRVRGKGKKKIIYIYIFFLKKTLEEHLKLWKLIFTNVCLFVCFCTVALFCVPSQSLLRNLFFQFIKFKDLKFLSLPLIGGGGVRVTAKVSLCLLGIYHLISLWGHDERAIISFYKIGNWDSVRGEEQQDFWPGSWVDSALCNL